ncbi:hypothetical protein BJ322DRAFT_593424 [Thelephora terrestris]|uniref:Uncharacterized protein n=1 Tax=Thelephora terrestris TaxID=56493 RepID=A0A9P6HKA2_9AGAM|nr:hypothetical protein BJ322DRAFT_593424 [Thelephora terrestris]
MPGQRNATDVVAEKHQPFDHLTTVVQPFETEGSRDVEFQQKINKVLLDLVLQFHAWAAAKPTREHESATELLEKEVNFIIEKEKSQGRCSVPSRSCVEQTRAMLGDFIKSVRSALAALGETL